MFLRRFLSRSRVATSRRQLSMLVGGVTPGGEALWKQIQARGPLSLSSFMRYALCDPTYGYYMQNKPVLGRDGDFTTSPEISQMFGEMIGVFAVHTWGEGGEPKEINVVEMGPGKGTLMSDFIRTTRQFSKFQVAMSVHLVELSPAMRKLQRATLKLPEPKVKDGIESCEARDGLQFFWHAAIDTVPKGPMLVIGQEFLDALPVHRFHFTDRGWCEVLVDVDTEKGSPHFRLVLSPGPNALSHKLVQAALIPTLPKEPKIGDSVEVCPEAWRVSHVISQRLVSDGGAALFIDYGQNSHSENSMQAVKNHQMVSLLSNVGEADVTAHVDFCSFLASAKAVGARTHGPVTQSEFLHRMGIKARLDQLCKKATPAQVESLTSGYQRLVADDQMGSLFKVAAISHPSLNLVGFSDGEAEETSKQQQ